MVILNESSSLATGVWEFIGFLLAIAGIVVYISLFLGLLWEKSSMAVKVTVFVLSLVSIFSGLIIAGETREKRYNVYLHDMSLEEFETEYEPIKIDGLVITARRKSDDKSGSD